MNVQVTTEPVLVPALFSDREHAESGIAELRNFGLQDRDIGVAVPVPGRYQRREPSELEVVGAVTSGAATGAPLGIIAGLHIAGFLASETLVIGVGGLLVAGAG